MSISTAEEFHKAIHSSVGTPQSGFKKVHHGKVSRYKAYSRVHSSDWATTSVNLKSRIINIDVYINFQQNSLSLNDYSRLKSLAIKGIHHYWTRSITLGSNLYSVIVNIHQRQTHSVGVDLYIERSKNYARSHNTGIIDASFFYNEGVFTGNRSIADQDFMLVSAHEFGHSILNYFGGVSLSWSHEGSTNIITQDVKSTTPGYPSNGEINLMKYYDQTKQRVRFTDRIKRSLASEKDVKRLIWLSKVNIK